MWEWLTNAVQGVGADPEDSEEIRIQKRMLVAVTGLVMVFGFVWGALLWVLGEPLAGAIPLGYSILTAVNLVVFSRTRKYQLFRTTQLLLLLILPFLLQFVLGGFVGGSAVTLWALMAPLGALIMQGRREAVPWLIAVGVLLAVSLVLQPSMTIGNSLGEGVVGLFFLLNLAAVTLIAFLVLNYFVGQRDRIQAQLEVEQAKSDTLLLNVLPKEVAQDLKDHGVTKARSHESVSVMFADVVGFTAYAGSVSPEKMLALLTEVFTRFDEISQRHGVEKIRTIGDSYMAAAGVPVERHDHAEIISRAALEMIDYVSGVDVEFRIGINSGPLVAGVIGTTKFQYDIWGDTVNTASRIESSGEPGRIQVSERTYELIKHTFECVPRGLVEMKGKGELYTWWLIGERDGEERPAPGTVARSDGEIVET
jgi:guanylate cyclase